jgi:hypothetical protein
VYDYADLNVPMLARMFDLDGARHLGDPIAYRRDRRKDQLLRENGYLPGHAVDARDGASDGNRHEPVGSARYRRRVSDVRTAVFHCRAAPRGLARPDRNADPAVARVWTLVRTQLERSKLVRLSLSRDPNPGKGPSFGVVGGADTPAVDHRQARWERRGLGIPLRQFEAAPIAYRFCLIE